MLTGKCHVSTVYITICVMFSSQMSLLKKSCLLSSDKCPLIKINGADSSLAKYQVENVKWQLHQRNLCQINPVKPICWKQMSQCKDNFTSMVNFFLVKCFIQQKSCLLMSLSGKCQSKVVSKKAANVNGICRVILIFCILNFPATLLSKNQLTPSYRLSTFCFYNCIALYNNTLT